MTYRECLIKTRKLINYYSIAGSIVADNDETQKDYTARAASAMDTAQKELAGLCPLVKHMNYVQTALRPLAIHANTFMLDGSFELTAEGAGAFSFTADGDVLAVLRKYENNRWREILAISEVSDGEEKLVWGELDTPPAENTKMSLTLSGRGVNITDLAMFRSFPKHEDIPLYGHERTRALPANFSRTAMLSAQPFRGRVKNTAFYSVNDGKISFPWDFCGKVDLAYEVYPRTVTEDVSDNFTFDLPENAAEVIPYFAAAMLLTDEDPKMSQFFLKMYNERCNALIRPEAQCVVNTLWR